MFRTAQGESIVVRSAPEAWVSLAANIQSFLSSGMGVRVERDAIEAPRDDKLEEGGRRAYTSLPGSLLATHLGESLELFYEQVRLMAAETLSREVVVSPYEESWASVKAFGSGDSLGWHLDTNPISTVIVLDGDVGDHALVYEDNARSVHLLQASPGDVLIFRGRMIRHCVALRGDRPRPLTLMLLNFYEPGDLWRPDGMEDFAVLGTD